ncbi:hypothetical protein SM033_00072 [Vibrio phage vB_VpaM_sm033]|nr:hypothetical protein SM033_00072 [Vibrio phage vB_VpaM_sm033]
MQALMETVSTNIYFYMMVAFGVLAFVFMCIAGRKHNQVIERDDQLSRLRVHCYGIRETLTTLHANRLDLPLPYVCALSNYMHELQLTLVDKFRREILERDFDQLNEFVLYLQRTQERRKFVFYITEGKYYLVDTRTNKAHTSSATAIILDGKEADCKVMEVWIDREAQCLKMFDPDGTLHVPSFWIAAFPDEYDFEKGLQEMEFKNYGNVAQ